MASWYTSALDCKDSDRRSGVPRVSAGSLVTGGSGRALGEVLDFFGGAVSTGPLAVDGSE